MSTISITDTTAAVVDVTISDSSPIAKAKLTQLVSSAKEIIKSFDSPVDKSDIGSVTLGGQFTSPSLLSGVASLTISAGANCELGIFPSSAKTLFDDDGFAPVIPIAANQAWVEFGVDATVGADLTASAEGFGVEVNASTQLSLLTYTLFEGSPLPSLKDALQASVEGFSLSSTPAAIRSQKAGTVNVCDITGSVTLTGSYGFPFSFSPFASANLPFNFKVSVAPTATAKVSAGLTLCGEFLVRLYKKDGSTLIFGLYKKRGTTFTVSLDVDAGIVAGPGTTDLLGKVLNAALPGVDAAKSGLSADDAKALNGVIKDALDRSIAAELNVSCSASKTDEAAVLYEVDLDGGNAATTDAALAKALKGDLTDLADLPNAKLKRNILVDTKERKQKISVNLLGILSAASVTDYVSKCTILTDDTGQITVVDKISASQIQVVSEPYRADPNKLRKALSTAFLATASYAAIGSKIGMTLAISQSYLEYEAVMSRQQMWNNIALGNFLGIIPKGLFDGLLASNKSFAHARVSASVTYTGDAALDLFFSDVAARTPRTESDLETVARHTMITLLDPNDPANDERIAALNSDSVWLAMDAIGNVGAFSTIPFLSHLNATELGAIEVDWVSVAWWRDAMLKVAPALSQVLATVDGIPAGTDPTQDPAFVSQHQKLSAVLGAVARNTKDAFVNGWGPSVMFALSGKHGVATMEVAWDGNDKHFGQSAT